MERVEIKDNPLKLEIYINGKPDISLMPKGDGRSACVLNEISGKDGREDSIFKVAFTIHSFGYI